MSDARALTWPASVARTVGGAADAGTPHPGRFASRQAPAADVETLMARFRAALEAVGGTVHHCTGVDAVAALIAEIAATAAADSTEAGTAMLSWAPEWLPVPGILEACAARGLPTIDATVRTDVDGHRADLQRLDAAVVGLTGAAALLADTGSIVATSGVGRPRLASLLPPVHVALVTRAQLVPSLGEWAAANAQAPAAVANLVLITGPSRTADIEMTLTRGVHGPRAVHVVFAG